MDGKYMGCQAILALEAMTVDMLKYHFFRLFLLVLTYQESIKIAPNGTCPATVSVCKCLASKALSNAKAICQFSRLRQAFIAEL